MKLITKPRLYGGLFFLVIIVFGLVYAAFSSTINGVNNLGNALYFSIVTITTLGFGDVTPANGWGQTLVGLEAISGVVLIGMFLNAISESQTRMLAELDKQRSLEERKAMAQAKLRQYYLLQKTIMVNYLVGAYVVVTPLEKRKFDIDVMHDQFHFTFNDMGDLYQMSLLLTQSFNKKSIEVYFEAQDRLYSELRTMIDNIDLSYWENLENLIHTYMKQCNDFGFRDSILGGNNKMAEPVYTKMIKEHEGELEIHPSNAKNQFIALYYMLQINIPLVQQMAEEMKKISEIDSKNLNAGEMQK